MRVIVVMKGDAHPRNITRLWRHTEIINKQNTTAQGVDAIAYTIKGFKGEEDAERYTRVMETSDAVVVAFPVGRGF